MAAVACMTMCGAIRRTIRVDSARKHRELPSRTGKAPSGRYWVWFEVGGRGWMIAPEGQRHFDGAALVTLELAAQP